MSENEGFFEMENEDTYFGTWNGIRDWKTYTGEEK